LKYLNRANVTPKTSFNNKPFYSGLVEMKQLPNREMLKLRVCKYLLQINS